MANDAGDGILGFERARERGEPFILRVLERQIIATFEFDAEREVIAAAAPAPVRIAGVPCTQLARYELDNLSVTPDQEM